MRIHYGLLLARQGHLIRSSEMIRRLRARGHRVSVSACGETQPAYASHKLGAFDFQPCAGLAVTDGSLAARAPPGRSSPPCRRACATPASSPDD